MPTKKTAKSLPSVEVFPTETAAAPVTVTVDSGTETQQISTAPVAPATTLPVPTADAQKENNTMNTITAITNTITPTESKKKGGLTKEQRAEKAKEIDAIRVRLYSELQSKRATMPGEEYDAALLNLSDTAEAEYRKTHPRAAQVRKSNGPAKGTPEAVVRFVVGRFLLKVNSKRTEPLTRDEAIALLTYGVDNPRVGKRTSPKAK